MAKRQRHLKFCGISERALALYRREVSDFLDYLEFNSIALPKSYGKLDKSVANYINLGSPNQGWLVAIRTTPALSSSSERASNFNWCRQHTPHRAIPITWEVVQAFVGLAMHQRWFAIALLYLVGFAFFLRTQELLCLEPEDFKVDVKEGSLVLRLRNSKTSLGNQPSLAKFDAKLALLVQHLLDRIPHQRRRPISGISSIPFASFLDYLSWG